MERKQFVLITIACFLSFFVALGVTETSATAKSHYKIEKISSITNPQRYRVKGTIWNQKFTKKITSKDRHKSTYFGTLYKATVKTPSGKKALYYGVGAMIPGMTISEPRLAGWTWHKNLYHKVSQNQAKKDIAFMKGAIGLLKTKEERQQAMKELNTVEPGTAYESYGWPVGWVIPTQENIKKSMQDPVNNFTTLGLVVTDSSGDADYIDSPDGRSGYVDPVENLKFLVSVYDHFRPRFAKEVPSMKEYDKDYKKIKSLSKMSQQEYTNYELNHSEGPSLDTAGYELSDGFAANISNLISGLNRSNQNVKKDMNFSTY